jgi:GrpB-like predicted nucleotidyltransferase (UPF0157 family)
MHGYPPSSQEDSRTMSVDIFQICDLDRGTLQAERDRILLDIRAAIPFASIMEVGSTAVDGVVGKQDLDFVVRVPLLRFEEARDILDKRFQRNQQQLSTAEYQGYLIPSFLDAAIQLIVEVGKHDNFERFLGLLRANGELRRAYNELKVAWNGRSMRGYRLAKESFIESALNNSGP